MSTLSVRLLACKNRISPIISGFSLSLLNEINPNRYKSTFCINANDKNYAKASFSNYGPITRGFAPGVDILSADHGSTDEYQLMSGTSMASPFVAGIMATYLSFEGKTLYGDAEATYKRVQDNMLRQTISGTPSQTPNHLVTTGINHPDRRSKDPYAGIPRDELKGTCNMAVDEIWTCGDVASNLYASISITGPKGEKLYATPGSAHSPGQPINDNTPLKIDADGLPRLMTVVGEHTNDHIQFYYGDQAWRSTTTTGASKCSITDPGNWGPPDCSKGATVDFLSLPEENIQASR